LLATEIGAAQRLDSAVAPIVLACWVMARILGSVACGVCVLAFGLSSACGSDDPAQAVPDDSEGGAGGDAGSAGGAAPVGGVGATSGTGGAAGDSTVGGHSTGGASGEVIDGCEAPSGAGTDVPTSITENETWTFEGSPYRIASTTYLTATLTLEPCTVVELAADAGILVGNDPVAGELVAHGDSTENAAGQTVRREIYFRRLIEDAPWGSIAVETTGNLDLALTRLEGGGSLVSAQNGGGTVLAYGPTPEGEAHPNVRLEQVTIADSETYGVNLQGRAAFAPGSDGLSIEGSGAETLYPIYLEAGVAFSLPTNLRLEGNERDEVLVHPFARVASDTFPARGVPLVLDQQLYVATPIDEPGTATLTIEAGVELKLGVGSGSGIMFGADAEHPGTLQAVGSASAPIWFHSVDAAPEPGAWMGLYFAYTTRDGNRLEHAVIEDAGAQSGAQGHGCGPGENNASVLVLSEEGAEPFIQNCQFKNAGGDTQILLGWAGSTDQDADAQAFVDTNTFADMPTCRVSMPGAAAPDPVCPGDSAPDCR
jgi:hypothetical protein